MNFILTFTTTYQDTLDQFFDSLQLLQLDELSTENVDKESAASELQETEFYKASQNLLTPILLRMAQDSQEASILPQ